MTTKPFQIYLLIFMCLVFFGCKKKIDDNAGFVQQLTHLKEFKDSEKRADSIKSKTGLPFQVDFSITNSPSLTGDRAGHTLVAFINLNRPEDPIILYTVKFDKKSQKIISIKKEHLGSSLKEFGWPADDK